MSKQEKDKKVSIKESTMFKFGFLSHGDRVRNFFCMNLPNEEIKKIYDIGTVDFDEDNKTQSFVALGVIDDVATGRSKYTLLSKIELKIAIMNLVNSYEETFKEEFEPPTEKEIDALVKKRESESKEPSAKTDLHMYQ